jgi:hypothetical protein
MSTNSVLSQNSTKKQAIKLCRLKIGQKGHKISYTNPMVESSKFKKEDLNPNY